MNIYGVVLALGNAPNKYSCPAQPGRRGICGGQFIVDNVDRGDSPGTGALGYLTVTGTRRDGAPRAGRPGVGDR